MNVKGRHLFTSHLCLYLGTPPLAYYLKMAIGYGYNVRKVIKPRDNWTIRTDGYH